MTQIKAFNNAAIQILQESAEPLHFNKIAEMALELRLIKLDENTIHNCMGAILHSDIMQYAKLSAFKSPKTGYYAINPDCPVNQVSIVPDKTSPIVLAFRNAAIKILQTAATPMHFTKIAESAMTERMIMLRESTIHSCMGAILHSDIRLHGNDSVFIAAQTGYYKLNPNHPLLHKASASNTIAHTTRAPPGKPTAAEPAEAASSEPPTRAPPGKPTAAEPAEAASSEPPTRAPPGKPTAAEPAEAASSEPPTRALPEKPPGSSLSTTYVGKGGEYLVAGKLSFLEYSVSIPALDAGIDLIVTKDNRNYYHIQVKTSTSSTEKYTFYLPKRAFERTASGSTFYVFVLRSANTDPPHENFLIVPYSKINEYVSGKYKSQDKNPEKFAINIIQKNNKFFFDIPDNDITFYENNWALII